MKINDNGTDRDMTETETAEYEVSQKLAIADNKANVKAETDKAKARQIVLDRLGITADEAALLLG
tara:strand:+ start:680 stop:874 length:195 start_codon:yes stop_codon:yes gene_type:complete